MNRLRKLTKHQLHADLALNFFKESLEDTNALSVEMIHFISNHPGMFFTLLPDDANLSRLHEFSISILPELPQQRGPIGSLPGIYDYSRIPSLEEECCEYLEREVKKNKSLCIIDSFNQEYKESFQSEPFDIYGKHYKKEIYYAFDINQFNKKDVTKCLHISKTFWHSLCILTEARLSKRLLQETDIQRICLKSHLVMIGAYDGDGYIFWEKGEGLSHE